MPDNEIFQAIDLLKIINSYANSGASVEQLASLYEIVSPHTPLNTKEKEKDINTRILSIIGGKKERLRGVTDDVRGYVRDADGEVSYSRMFSDLNITSKEDKDLARHAMKKMVAEKIVETTGKKSGIFRKIDNDETIIDWRNADDQEYKIKLPLGVHNLVKIYPGNIIVLAGASNTGKTSFMLETVRLNQRDHEVFYFNSEMGATELKSRLQLFSEVLPIEKWNFTAIERASNFADRIRPKGLNIIDFMEVYDDFWKIGGWIRDIHAKLDGGVAIIAIQKKTSTKKDSQDYGRGGELTLEKPRLYLAMDRGKLKVVKAKAWKDHNINPNGLIRAFNIINGWKFLPKTEWTSEEGINYSTYGIVDDKKPQRQPGEDGDDEVIVHED